MRNFRTHELPLEITQYDKNNLNVANLESVRTNQFWKPVQSWNIGTFPRFGTDLASTKFFWL